MSALPRWTYRLEPRAVGESSRVALVPVVKPWAWPVFCAVLLWELLRRGNGRLRRILLGREP